MAHNLPPLTVAMILQAIGDDNLTLVQEEKSGDWMWVYFNGETSSSDYVWDVRDPNDDIVCAGDDLEFMDLEGWKVAGDEFVGMHKFIHKPEDINSAFSEALESSMNDLAAELKPLVGTLNEEQQKALLQFVHDKMAEARREVYDEQEDVKRQQRNYRRKRYGEA